MSLARLFRLRDGDFPVLLVARQIRCEEHQVEVHLGIRTVFPNEERLRELEGGRLADNSPYCR